LIGPGSLKVSPVLGPSTSDENEKNTAYFEVLDKAPMLLHLIEPVSLLSYAQIGEEPENAEKFE